MRRAQRKAAWRIGLPAMAAYLAVLAAIVVLRGGVDLPAWLAPLALPPLVYGLAAARWMPRASVARQGESAAPGQRPGPSARTAPARNPAPRATAPLRTAVVRTPAEGQAARPAAATPMMPTPRPAVAVPPAAPAAVVPPPGLTIFNAQEARPPAPTDALPPPAQPPRHDGEPRVRIPFARVTDQLPADAFAQPVTALGPSLREPGVLLVPQRLVASQLAEGCVQVAWDVVADQVPASAKLVSDAAIAEKLPNAKLVLPLDELFKQLPPALFAVKARAQEIASLESFPLPFQPTATSSTAEATTAAEPSVPSSDPPESTPTIVREVAPEPAPCDAVLEGDDPQVTTVPVAANPVAATSPAARLGDRRELRAESQRDEDLPDVFSDIAPLLRPLTVVRSETSIANGARVRLLVSPGLARAGFADVVAQVMPLLCDGWSGGPAEQVTIRRGTDVLVVTGIGPVEAGGPVLAITPPTGAVALAECMSQRAAADWLAHADVRTDGGAEATPGEADLRLERRAAGARLEEIARTIDVFSELRPAAFRDAENRIDVYVLRARPTAWEPLARVAIVAYRVLAMAEPARTPERVSSMTIRLRKERVFIRHIELEARPALLIVAGDVRHPGLAHVQIDRAVARLGRA